MVFFAPSSATLKLVMKPSSLRIRAISVFSLEAGTSTLGWRALIALRTRVSMSAIGSLVIPALQLFLRLSPARLRDAGDFPVQRQLAEAQTADAELAQKR